MFFLFETKNYASKYSTEIINSTLPPLLSSVLTREASEDFSLNFSSGESDQRIRTIEDELSFIICCGYVRALGGSKNLEIEEIETALSFGVRKFGGQYLIVRFDKKTLSTTIYSTIARIIPCYFHIGSDGLIISNRQSAIAGLIGARLNLDAAYSFVRNGYYVNEMSAFNSISLVKSNAVTTIDSAGSVDVIEIDQTLSAIGTQELNDISRKRLKDAAANSFNPAFQNKKVKIGITGGRDSRLIAAMVTKHVPKTEISMFTKGEETDADVILGKKVADFLNIDHEVTPPAKVTNQSSIKVNIASRIKQTIINGDFSLSAYDNLASSPKKFSFEQLSYAGNGGELLRSPLAFANQDLESARRAIFVHGDSRQIFRSDKSGERYNYLLKEWMDGMNPSIHASDLLKRFSLQFRTGRWGSASYMASYSKLSQRPFYDNDLLSEVLPLSSHYSESEAIYYEMLVAANEGLVGIPFDKGVLQLHKSPVPEYRTLSSSLVSFDELKPNRKRVAAVNWRRRIVGILGDELCEIVNLVASNNSDFAEFIDVDKYSDFIRSIKSRLAGTIDSKVAWSVATLAMMVDMASNTIDDQITRKSIEVFL
ncbi:hypothetical protein [Arthrobacter sp. MYb222]|uniref:hypothetical protein n=1 Tax=Arthrobacter sp. MYb222 TaxID=1848599 RepID=UPI0011B0C3FC|nr:hypothetical protein [Arthrobacter sp. MYb222]